MNIELDEVVVMDISDDALEQAAGGAQGAWTKGVLVPGSTFVGPADCWC